MSEKFYNPYQFIPVTGTVNGTKPRAAIDPILSGHSETHPWVRHDLWHREALSGRIVCSLFLATPTAVGADQVEEDGHVSKRVKPYRWQSNPAIPGNSLKGMVASIAEAISQSSLRVLESWMEPRAKKTHEYRIKDPGGDRTGRPVKLKTSMHDLFARIDPDMVPWIRRRDALPRDALTPAELLFGVVEEIPAEAPGHGGGTHGHGSDPEDTEGRNLAGRLRFHDARSHREIKVFASPHTLRVLNSPKLPCPSMYFHRRGERGRSYMDKDAFHDGAHDEGILPNGRKVYLHHRQDPASITAQRWRTGPDADSRNERLKLRAQPMLNGQRLYFHVDFENLAPAELTLLEYALAPSPQFRHRVGLGRPLGLGSVVLAVEGVFLNDRGLRYGPDAFDTPESRYEAWWRPAHSPTNPDPQADWSALYPREKAIRDAQPNSAKPAGKHDPSLIDTQTLDILKTVGDPDMQLKSCDVHTPMLPGQHDPERKTYEWFNENDERGGQVLPAVEPGKKLTPLCSDWRDCQDQGDSGSGQGPNDPGIAAWLERILPDDIKGGGKDKLAGFITNKTMADAVVALATTDAALCNKVFAWLKCEWHKKDPTMPLKGIVANRAIKVYEKAGLHLTDDPTQ